MRSIINLNTFKRYITTPPNRALRSSTIRIQKRWGVNAAHKHPQSLLITQLFGPFLHPLCLPCIMPIKTLRFDL